MYYVHAEPPTNMVIKQTISRPLDTSIGYTIRLSKPITRINKC
jgi:hypothetical protein